MLPQPGWDWWVTYPERFAAASSPAISRVSGSGSFGTPPPWRPETRCSRSGRLPVRTGCLGVPAGFRTENRATRVPYGLFTPAALIARTGLQSWIVRLPLAARVGRRHDLFGQLSHDHVPIDRRSFDARRPSRTGLALLLARTRGIRTGVRTGRSRTGPICTLVSRTGVGVLGRTGPRRTGTLGAGRTSGGVMV